MNILLAGGAGYIGSHTAVSLLEAGHDVVIVDNFANSSPVAVERLDKWRRAVEQNMGKEALA